MSLPVFKTLGELQADMTDRLGYGNMGSSSGVLAGNIKNILQTSQYQLYWMFDWKYLLRTFDQPCGVGQRFYGLPSDLDSMQLQSVVSEEIDGQDIVEHVVNGGFAHNALGWTDSSSGDGSIAWNSGQYLDLIDTATSDGTADQQQSGLEENQVYTLSYEVVKLGDAGVSVWLGTTQNSSDLWAPPDSSYQQLGLHSVDIFVSVSDPWIRLNATGATSNDTAGVTNISLKKKGSGFSDGKIWPMTEGVDWQHDSYSNTNSRPLRYEIRDQIEVWPPPDKNTYVLRYEYLRKLAPFSVSTDRATVDDTVLFLHALATAKGHYGQKDFNIILANANSLMDRLRAKNHGNRRYVRRNPHADKYRLEHDDDYCNLIHKNILDV